MAVPEIERFELRLRMDATVSVTGPTGEVQNWLKPGTEVAATWRGFPSDAEVVLRYNSLKERCTDLLEEIVVTIHHRLEEARRGQ